MKKRLASLTFMMALFLCVIPVVRFTEVSATAMSNASALTPFVYKTGDYTALRKLTLYTTAEASTSAGKTLPVDTKVNVTSVSGEYGKVTYDGKTGWINLSYALNPQNKADVAARLDMLRKKFPAGMYWNRPSPDVNNPDGYTDQPCPSGHTDHRDNTFDGTGQCHGFAIKLGYDLFGMHASCWERHYDIEQIKVGDLVRYRGRHTVMITGVYSTYFTVADCNWDYSCNIEWDRKMKKSYISFYEDNKNDGVYHCPINGGSVLPTTTTTSTTTTTTTQATTTTTTVSSQKYVLSTKLSVNAKSSAVLAKSTSECYYATGVTVEGITSYTFTAPAGTYPEFVIIAENCKEYCIQNFRLGTDKLPTAITLNRIAAEPELKITSQPANVSVKAGKSATFTVKASSDGLKYQWYYRKSGSDAWSVWNGRTTASTTATSNATWNGMLVRCKVTDSSGDAVFSSSAKVTLLPDLKITSQPANVSVKDGKSATFTVKASGDGLTYQWYYRKSGSDTWSVWNGRTTASTTATSNATWNGMLVRCKVTDSAGDSVTSSSAKVTILPDLKITSQPANVSVKDGKSATFTVKASGDGLKYQWYYRKSGSDTWSVWNGRTTASTTATSNATWNRMLVRCKVTDSSGDAVFSSSAKVTILPDLKITLQPANVSVKDGKSATFTVKASGEGLTYQWYYKKSGADAWSVWNGRTTASTTATSNATWNGMLVRCKVTDSSGDAVFSSSAKVTIS